MPTSSFLLTKRKKGNKLYAIAPVVAAAAIAAGSQLIGGALGSKGQADANKTNMKIAERQNQWNIDQWQRENEYNTPSAQLHRLKEAGLNPNLIYGNGQAVQSSAPSPRAVGATVSNEKQGLSQGVSRGAEIMANVIMQQAEYNKLNAASELARNQADLARVNQEVALSTAAKNRAQEQYYGTGSDLNVQRSEMMSRQIENIDANTIYVRSKTTGQETYNKYADDLHKSKIEVQNSARALNEANVRALSEKIAQAWKSLDLDSQRTDYQSRESYNRVNLIQHNIQKLQQGYDIQEITKEMLEQKLDYKHVNAFFDALNTATKWIPFN